MILSAALFHLSILFCLELIALTGALFLFLYIKKENFEKMYSYISVGILSFVILTMLGSFVGAICMHCCRQHGESEEKRIFIQREMGHGMGMGMEGMGRGMWMHGMGMERGMGEGMGRHHGNMRMDEGCPEGGGREGCSEMGECRGEGMKGCEKTEGCEMECCKNKEGHAEMKPGKMMTRKDSIMEKKQGKK